MHWQSRTDERRSIRKEKEVRKRERLTAWHRWFAWHPVRTTDKFDMDERWDWLCFVERKRDWWRSTLKFEDGAGFFGGPSLTGCSEHFGYPDYRRIKTDD